MQLSICALAAVVVEVDSTIGERHIYFFRPGPRPKELAKAAHRDDSDYGAAPPQTRAYQTRTGLHSITTTDPLATNAQGPVPINTVLVLQSLHGHEKLVVRFCAEAVVDPTEMTAWQALRLVATTWWLGLFVDQKEVNLAQKKKPRTADWIELRLETAFRRYLQHVVEKQATTAAAPSRRLAVTYIPCGIPGVASERILSGTAAGQQDKDVDEVEIRVLTPVFYRRFVCYAHDVEALFCELRESCTIDVSRPELLAKLVLAKTPRPPLQVTGVIDFLFFKAIQRLRRRPERLAPPAKLPGAASSYVSTGDLRGFRLSAMDGFVLALKDEAGRDLRRSYRATVLAVFLADRTALGSYRVFQAQCLLVRLLVAWAAVEVVLSACSHG
ncbi:hypothetical protein CMQ_706 [Grosmannia clavigera kw1407]|uniref:Uncharacterized protein n=1 Tax=Grosmannia clavigera (strain kw1407 / UAMH 11150) TaxID=655863 RepID=F0XDJ7_GROCL|nr:uncharacterized protein CMQ_706 [Grosmannia clavigera kw1407]EFX03778.1 hypothetical protein CMQ_706 [Grosmannia clavigera kw1407]